MKGGRMSAESKSNDTNVSQLKENEKKQVPLRLSATLWRELAAWAEDDFRSINGQIEYLLTECVRYRKKTDKNKDLFSKE